MVGVVLIVGLVLAEAAAPPCGAECGRVEAERLIDAGELRAAVDRLKEARAGDPDDKGLVLLLARAYLMQDNLFWAERVLADGLETWPADPELLAWMAAVHLRQGDPDLAAEDLNSADAPVEDPLRARWQLLDASRARLAGDVNRADELLDFVAEADAVYPEDQQPFAALRARVDPWWTPVLSGTLDLRGGRTSNALAGSPTDPGEGGEASNLVMPELRARLEPPTPGRFAPLLDLEVLGNLLSDDEAKSFSTLLAGVRLGGAVSFGDRRLTFGYRVEGLVLEDESGLYSEARRGEFELEWASGRVLFGGVGRREYSDERRTRWEGDLGFGGALGAIGGAPVVAGATIRVADAESDAYDQLGVSAALSSTLALGRGASLRLALSAIWDDYFNSGGAEGLLVFGTEEKRRDLLGRVGLTLWGPQWRDLRPGLEVRATRRQSTADERAGFDFSYTEWRAVFWLRWSFSLGRALPKVSATPGHVPLDWGGDSSGGMEQERILDLLRRDEELRRGTSCSVSP